MSKVVNETHQNLKLFDWANYGNPKEKVKTDNAGSDSVGSEVTVRNKGPKKVEMSRQGLRIYIGKQVWIHAHPI